MAELEVRHLEGADTDAVLGLLRASLGEETVPRTRRFWQWKHLDNPFGPSPGLVALHGEELVGLRVFLRWRWRAGAEEIPAVRAVDTATHPAWQGRGIFRRLTEQLVEELRAEGVAFVFNTPNAKSRAGYLTMGWQDLGRASVLLRPTGLGALFGGRHSRVGTADQVLGRFPAASELLLQPGLAPLLESCARSALAAKGMHTAASLAYLDWRYARCPERDYRALWDFGSARGNGEGAALIFRGRSRRGRFEVALCEILVGSGSEDAGRASELVRQVARSRSADYLIGLAASGSRARSVLRRSGFWLSAPGPSLTVRPLAEVAPRRATRWWLSAGDLELF